MLLKSCQSMQFYIFILIQHQVLEELWTSEKVIGMKYMLMYLIFS